MEITMRADLKAMMAADLANHFADQSDTATIMTQSGVDVVVTSEYQNQNTDEIGDMPQADMSLMVQTADLTVTPVVDGLVAFNGKSYRIASIETHPDGNVLTLALQHVSQ